MNRKLLLKNVKITNNNKLLVVGSVAFDTITTPFGKIAKTLGGSASYFGLAASYFTQPAIVAVIGNDFTTKYKNILVGKNIDLTGLQKAKGKTFAWGGKYSFDLNSRTTLFTKLNVFEKFKPALSPSHINSGFLFLGNIHPLLQLDVLKQAQGAKFVGLDTMNYWIESEPNKLGAVLKKVDVLIINDSKIFRMMKKTGDSQPPILIIKRGEYGLLMFQGTKIFHLPGFPLEDVKDPTGAGDSFAGGFMGYISSTHNTSWENLKRACVAGSVMASFCVEEMGTKGLLLLTQSNIAKRLKDFTLLTQF